MNCRHCSAPLQHVFIDLGHQPPSNAYLTAAALDGSEVHAPLRTYVCDSCWLVQLPQLHRSDELFTPDYAYFSSVAKSWVAHSERYVTHMIDRLELSSSDWVVEVASNDGYLLQFVRDAGIPCTGIEPTASTATEARSKGVDTIERFFGGDLARELVRERGQARLVIANNVLAHVPDIEDFVSGFAILLEPEGVATFEFPHVAELVAGCQFDTIYHEHYSYLSLTSAQWILAGHGLRIFDVERLPTHGGSLRLYACHAAAGHPAMPAVAQLLAEEKAAGLQTLDYYKALGVEAARIKLDLLEFLVAQKRAGKLVAGYGAAAKGNTLLNYAGIDSDLLAFVCDAAPSKQGHFLPGSHIPILPPDALAERRPEFLLVLPWNLRHEIVADHGYIANWGGKFVAAVPRLEVF